MCKILADEDELLAGIAPPLRDVRLSEPAPHHWKMRGGERMEFVCHDFSVSTVRLRLV